MAVKGLWESLDEFLKQCERSGDCAYNALRLLLERLEDPNTRVEARIFLSDLQKRFGTKEESDRCLQTFHFQIQDIFLEHYEDHLLYCKFRGPVLVLSKAQNGARLGARRGVAQQLVPRLMQGEATWDRRKKARAILKGAMAHGDEKGYQRRKKLTMMVIPSIFVPEDWSFTFYEGLNRHPDTIFKDKTVAELGCGNGWISIAIAEKWLPSKVDSPASAEVYGLDINPRAIKISWINLYLNALDENGQPIYDGEGKTLLERVEFYESDLLSYCKDHHIELERIVGCIPQILNPNPEAMSKMITENASEEFLHSLSNYCALQGFVEDQFGLGLIARAVEEGIDIIKPFGIMIFNMGGRPGQGVCKRLFERRGVRVTKLWQTKILQAADTDISALVEIEKNSRHRFEFFMGLAGDQPICARTAWAYGKAGGRISHALSVYSCQLRQPTQGVSNSLDLSFEDDSVADEKIPFLAYLASVLKRSSFFPYEPPAGSKWFRNLISGFIKTYHHIPVNADIDGDGVKDLMLFVFPSRAVAIENALRLFSPRLAIVDEHLSRHLPRQWLTSLAIENTLSEKLPKDVLTVIEAPRQSDLMIELIKKLKPQVVVTGMAEFEAITSSAFQQLLETTRVIGARIFLDISDQFELSSLPGSIGVLKYLAGTALPPHAAIICGLLKNKVYSDLEVAFVLSEEETIFKALSKTVELLEGNTALISQYYYGCLFHDLLAFQLADRHPPSEREGDKVKCSDMIGFASSAISVLDHAELSITETENSSLIHMDVDQSFLPIPSPVKAAIFESFARQNVVEPELDVTTSIRQFIKSNYGFPTNSNTEFIYADCPLPLFNKLVLCCIQEGGTLCFPAGSNGNYVSAAKFLKANISTIPTNSELGFKLTEKILTGVIETVKKPWVVIIDTSFSGLEFDSKGIGSWELEHSLAKLNCSGLPTFSVSLLGGLCMNMLTGGLTFGFLVQNQPFMIDTFHSFSGPSKPHSTLKYTLKKLLDLKEQKDGDLLDAIEKQKKLLGSRSKRLKEVSTLHL
ncbi:methionine S-methyltransferase [Actinidia rufa]|uniref:methionine S-methyltransferase n=1 Tax=Actinidia rufa TaxID=165716 RepID=A0A7J0GFE8_9ERIC|nr:methionine S-methyltransferase [Actinidia rufa]